jgi:HEAT repeat protein
LVAALESRNGTQRDLALQKLLWRADKKAAAPLAKLATTSKRAEARLYALCALDGLSELKADLVISALADAHPGVRRHAVRLAERFLPSPAVRRALASLVDDADAQVRLQVAYTLGEPNASDGLTR